MHTVFIATFGGDYLIVALHTATILAFVSLIVLRRRAESHANG